MMERKSGSQREEGTKEYDKLQKSKQTSMQVSELVSNQVKRKPDKFFRESDEGGRQRKKKR